MMESAKISQRLLQLMLQSRSSLCSSSLCGPFGGRTHVVAAAFSCLPSQDFARGTFVLVGCALDWERSAMLDQMRDASLIFQQTSWVAHIEAKCRI